MPTVFLPALLRPLAGGASSVEADGATLRAVIDDLDRQHPGLTGASWMTARSGRT